MFESVRARGQSRWVGGSIAAHAAVLALLLIPAAARLSPAARPGEKSGKMVAISYMPGGSPIPATPAASHATHIAATPTPVLHAVENPKLAVPVATTSVAAPTEQAALNSDALGDGNVTLALVDNHPHPQPALPAGTHGDVVVDITIGADGRLAKSTLVRGLGSAIDSTVLSTIATWTWKPATKDGAPIASEQELLFHYDSA